MFLSPRLVSTNVKIKIYRGTFVLVLYVCEDGLSQPRTIIHSMCGAHLGRRKDELQEDKSYRNNSSTFTLAYTIFRCVNQSYVTVLVFSVKHNFTIYWCLYLYLQLHVSATYLAIFSLTWRVRII
jgi:hypothetical protein